MTKTKIVGIGKALYKDGTQIRVSKPDDWGWFYDSWKDEENNKENEENKERTLFVIKVVRKSGRWKAEIVGNPQNLESIEIQDNEEFRPDIENGLLHSFHANITKKHGGQPVDIILETDNRISLACYERQGGDIERSRLIPESGYYPSIYLFMLGATNCGKTCWNYALNTSGVREKVVKHYNKRNARAEYFENRPPRVAKFKPTGHEDVKLDTCIQLRKENDYIENDYIRALAFIVDLAGEVANVRNNKQTQRRLRDSIKRYASGIFVIRNKEWLFNELLPNQIDPVELISQLKQGVNAIGRDKFCYILTSADKIKREIEAHPDRGEILSLTPDSPIFNENASMYENMAVTSYIMVQKDAQIKYKDGTCSTCFTISSGEEDDEFFDCGKGYNAELPLVYMLKSLVKID